MATVHFSAGIRKLTGGEASIEVVGDTLGEVIDNIDRLHPGFREGVLRNGVLKPGVSVIAEGRGVGPALSAGIDRHAEVNFLLTMSGGA
jgi:hypothetical protein